VCKRYPNRRPSNYVGLTGYEALRFDLASAYLGEYSDYDREGSHIDEILSGFVMLAKVQGAKKIKQPKRKRLVGELFEKEHKMPTVEEVIAQLNTPGTVIER
jgi:hypothetical protein